MNDDFSYLDRERMSICREVGVQPQDIGRLGTHPFQFHGREPIDNHRRRAVDKTVSIRAQRDEARRIPFVVDVQASLVARACFVVSQTHRFGGRRHETRQRVAMEPRVEQGCDRQVDGVGDGD